MIVLRKALHKLCRWDIAARQVWFHLVLVEYGLLWHEPSKLFPSVDGGWNILITGGDGAVF